MEKKGRRNLSGGITEGVQSADGTPSFTLLEDVREAKEKKEKKQRWKKWILSHEASHHH